MSVSLTLDEYNKLFTKSRLVVVAHRKVTELEEHITELKKLNATIMKQLRLAVEQRDHAELLMAIKASLHDEEQRRDEIDAERILQALADEDDGAVVDVELE